MSSNESTIITLKGPDDWDAWEKQFKAEATRRSLLEHIEVLEAVLEPYRSRIYLPMDEPTSNLLFLFTKQKRTYTMASVKHSTSSKPG